MKIDFSLPTSLPPFLSGMLSSFLVPVLFEITARFTAGKKMLIVSAKHYSGAGLTGIVQ